MPGRPSERCSSARRRAARRGRRRCREAGSARRACRGLGDHGTGGEFGLEVRETGVVLARHDGRGPRRSEGFVDVEHVVDPRDAQHPAARCRDPRRRAGGCRRGRINPSPARSIRAAAALSTVTAVRSTITSPPGSRTSCSSVSTATIARPQSSPAAVTTGSRCARSSSGASRIRISRSVDGARHGSSLPVRVVFGATLLALALAGKAVNYPGRAAVKRFRGGFPG